MPFIVSTFFFFKSTNATSADLSVLEALNIICFVLLAIILVGACVGIITRKNWAEQMSEQKNSMIFQSESNEKWYKNNIKNILQNADTETYKNIAVRITDQLLTRVNFKGILENDITSHAKNIYTKKETIVYEQLFAQGVEKMHLIKVLYKNSDGK